MPASTLAGRTADAIEHLFPGYFALVMATGIVSIASWLLQMPLVARALVVVNVAAYACLGVLLAARLAFYFRRARAPRRSPEV